MPIDGLTEINRPPRQGMLRLGIKKKAASGVEYPSEVDYFILDPETPDPEEKERLITEFHKAFGEKPKSIAITLTGSDIDDIFPQNYKRYGKNTSLKCIGDGQTATCTEEQFATGLKTIGHDDRGLPQVECKGRECAFATTNEQAKNKECKATATLSMKIHCLGGIGVWQVTTGSFNSIVNINSCIRDLVREFGRAHALPLILERRPQETTFKGKKTTHYTLHINTDKSIGEMVRQAQIAPDRVLIEAYGTEVAALPAPDEIMDAETTQEPEKTQDKPTMINCPPVVEGEVEKTVTESGKVGVGFPEQTPEQLAEYDKTTKKVAEAFSGTIDSKETGDGIKAKVDEPFLEGLKDDAKKELGVEGGKPVKSRAIDKEKARAEYPKSFPKFMAFCKAKLEAVNKGAMYADTFSLYSVKSAKDLEADAQKQGVMRVYLEALLEEEGAV